MRIVKMEEQVYPPTEAITEELRKRLREIALEADREGQPRIARMAREALSVRPESIVPSFPLKASDAMAPSLIQSWIAAWSKAGGVPEHKLISAKSVLATIVQFQKDNGTIRPD